MGPSRGYAGSSLPHDGAFPSSPPFSSSLPSPSHDFESPSLQRTNLASPRFWADAVPAEPGASRDLPVMTPAEEVQIETDMNTIVAGALAPTHESAMPTAAPLSKAGLRLPSFEALGIASPHPDHRSLARSDTCLARLSLEEGSAAPASAPSDTTALQAGDDLSTCSTPGLGRGVHANIKHYVSTLTPPAERGELDWNTVTARPSSQSTHATGADSSTPSRLQAETVEGQPSGESGYADVGAFNSISQRDLWIEGAVRALVRNLRTASTTHNPLKVLSHALPSPSPEGHIFSEIISTVHASTPSSPTTWINVFHAVPGRFNLADLPTSPPVTPGLPIGGEDYFAQKIFDSAVAIPDYQEKFSSLPRTLRAVVPPSSIDISIVERYIPPTSAREFIDMFNIDGPSILVDRLIELSPHNGSLAFIYPTKTGARTFLHEYLSPILDPILRSTVVINGLSADMSKVLGEMAVVDQLPEYTDIEAGVVDLCSRLTRQSASMPHFYGRKAEFEVSYSANKEVVLPRGVWINQWWSRQEKPKIREVVTKYTQEAQRRNSHDFSDRSLTATELVQQLLDGIAKKAYPSGGEPTMGVEVSVVVVKRSK